MPTATSTLTNITTNDATPFFSVSADQKRKRGLSNVINNLHAHIRTFAFTATKNVFLLMKATGTDTSN